MLNYVELCLLDRNSGVTNGKISVGQPDIRYTALPSTDGHSVKKFGLY